jgi:hypothetical protein
MVCKNRNTVLATSSLLQACAILGRNLYTQNLQPLALVRFTFCCMHAGRL